MPRQALTVLCSVVVALNAVTASVSMTAHRALSHPTYVSARGTAVQLDGGAPYAFDTLFAAAGFRAQDTVTLLLALPLLVFCTWKQQRNPRARVLLSGVLAYFLYVAASMAFGTAYNPLFLLYVASLSAALFAFVLVTAMPLEFTAMPARRGPAAFLIISGAVTLFVWTVPLLDGVATRRPPALLDHYTTMVTYALDLAIVTPAAFLSAALVLRGKELGYRIAVPLSGLIVLLAPVIALSTFYQRRAGIVFTPAEIVGPISGFLLLGLAGARVLVLVLMKVKVHHDPAYASHLARPAAGRQPQRRIS